MAVAFALLIAAFGAFFIWKGVKGLSWQAASSQLFGKGAQS